MRWLHESDWKVRADKGQRLSRRASGSCMTARSCLWALALVSPRGWAQTPVAAPGADHDSAHIERMESPGSLAITVFSEEAGVETFAQRVESWFHDGTTVRVESATLSGSQLVPAARPGIVTIWVLLRSKERALVTFSMQPKRGPERHLVRDVRLRNSLDELGLERLATLIQSTVVALREGLEGSDLETLKSELRSAGVELREPPVMPQPSQRGPGSAQEAATGAERAVAATPEVETRPRDLPHHLAPRSPERQPEQRPPRFIREVGPRFDVSYGARYVGEHAATHGPSLGFGWPIALRSHVLWLSFRTGAFFPSTFDASPFRLSVQTSWARTGVTFEWRSASPLSAYGALLGGVDVARVGSRLEASTNDDSDRYTAGRTATRVWGQVGVVAGIWYRTAIDIGLFGTIDYCTSDVRYVVESASGDRTVLSSWRWQPALFVSARFGVTHPR